MTAPELISHLNRVFGLNERPKTYEVDAETYANCCQYLFQSHENTGKITLEYKDFYGIEVFLGKTKNGLMFKGVELILQGYKR